MEHLVHNVETLCDAFEAIPKTVTDRVVQDRFIGDPRPLCIAATLANMRVFYFVTQFHSPPVERARAFEQFRFLLTDKNSNWHTMTDDEKVQTLYMLKLVCTEVLVFSLW